MPDVHDDDADIGVNEPSDGEVDPDDDVEAELAALEVAGGERVGPEEVEGPNPV